MIISLEQHLVGELRAQMGPRCARSTVWEMALTVTTDIGGACGEMGRREKAHLECDMCQSPTDGLHRLKDEVFVRLAGSAQRHSVAHHVIVPQRRLPCCMASPTSLATLTPPQPSTPARMTSQLSVLRVGARAGARFCAVVLSAHDV